MELLGVIAVLLLAGALIIYSALSWGFVLYKFWYWFLLPVIPLGIEINFFQAVGLSLFLAVFKTHSSLSIKKEHRDLKQELINVFCGPWVVLSFAWFIKVLFL